MGRGMGPMHGMLQQEVSKPKNTWETVSRLGRYFMPYAWVLLIVIALILGAAYTNVRTPELTGQSVDCFFTPALDARMTGQSGSTAPAGLQNAFGQQAAQTNCWFAALPQNPTTEVLVHGLGQLVLVIIALAIAGALMNGLLSYLMNWSGQKVLLTLRKQVFSHMHKLSLGYYSTHETGAVMSRIVNDMDTLQQAVNFVLVNLISGVVMILWIGVKMFTYNWGYALISMAVTPLMVLVTILLSNQARKAFRRTRIEIGKVNANLEESISGVREVQAFGREGANIEAFRESNAANRDANIKAVSYTAAMQPTMEALSYVAIAIVTITGGFLLLGGGTMFGAEISLGLIITFIGFVQRFNQPISQISQLWTNMQSAVAGAERIFELLDTVPDVQDVPNAVQMPPIQGRVAFENVSAQYVPGEPVLEDVSFTAEPGQTIAIVGQTGAGKTTIINLLPRFYDVVTGKILIDGYDVAEVSSASLRKQIGIVLQDTFLFSDTVMNNIRFGRPDASEEEVIAAAKLSHADDFIQRMPQGYNTVLGEHGAGLSQGQRQLLAIARAALANPRILILDEATSSVDTRTERQIQSALERLLEGRTSFVIAHRLSTIRNADQVLVIEEGRIVERGTHASLLAQKGVYYNLYMRQFRKEEPEKGNGQVKDLAPGRAG
jgi:ATP-binding cassette subfamily B multidrug efflux pump